MTDDDLYDHSLEPIKWKGAPPSPERLAMVRESIRTELDALPSPPDLIFHTVFFDADPRGATATIWGEADGFHGEWTETTRWVGDDELPAPHDGDTE